jgi:flagellar basal-body rod protein FlgG
MIQSLHTAASGLTKSQQSLDVIGQNLANVNNTGYRAVRADFADMIIRRLTSPVDNGPEFNLNVAVGSRLSRTARLMNQGALIGTGRPFDFAIDGDAFFMIGLPDGNVGYTRDGAFYLSVNEDGSANLVDANGFAVLGENGLPIVLSGDVTGVVSGPEGQLMIDGEWQATLGFTVFENPGSLQTGPNGLLLPTENTGAAAPAASPVRQGMLENSNVDYATEMTRMIRAQRAYQLASRAVTMADQMMGLASSIR